MSSLLRTVVRPLAMRAMLVREWWQSGVAYNPLSPRVYLNPYPKYAELRAKAPLHWSPLLEAWVATRYADGGHEEQHRRTGPKCLLVEPEVIAVLAITRQMGCFQLETLGHHGNVRSFNAISPTRDPRSLLFAALSMDDN